MRRLLLTILLLLSRADLAGANCTIDLVNDLITAPQTEFARQLIQGIVPGASDVALVRIADIEAGVRRMGFEDERAGAFVDLVEQTLRMPGVQDADPHSALGRAARRLTLAARDPRALTVALLRQRATNELLFLFAGRGTRVGTEGSGAPGQPTFTDTVFDRVPGAPMPHGLILMEPTRFTDPAGAERLRVDLLATMATYEVSLTLFNWARAHRDDLKTRRAAGLTGYLNLNRDGTIVIDGGLAHILMFGQINAVKTAFAADPGRLNELNRDLVLNIKSHPKAAALARRQKIDTSAGQAIDWSKRTMDRIYGDLAL